MVVDGSSAQRQWGLYVLSGATADTSPALMLVFDSQRYLFNAGEGTTRSLVARSAGFRKLDTIFATRADVAAMQGLPGLLLTLAEHHGDESFTTKVNLVLPPGGTHLLSCSRFHARRNKVDLKLHELSAESVAEPVPCYTDRHIVAYSFPAVSAASSSRKRKRSPSPEMNGSSDPTSFSGSRALSYIRNVISDMFHSPSYQYTGARPSPAWDARNLPAPSATERVSMSYLCIGPVQRGKFRPDLAKAQGVQPGPAFGKLHRGERVQGKDGNWVEPSSCVEADGPRRAFLLLDCPSPDHVACLTGSAIVPVLAKEKATLKTVFHLLGPGMLAYERYWAWAKTLGEVEHVVSAAEYEQGRISYGAAWLQQIRLTMLDPACFPLLHHESVAQAELCSAPHMPSNTSLWQADTRYELGAGKFAFGGIVRDFDLVAPAPEADARAAKLYVPSGNSPLDAKLTKAGEEAWTDFVELKTVAQDEIRAEGQKRGGRAKRPFDEVVVTTLGTGSAAPAQYRNVSSTLVEIPDTGSLLLDAGENTLGQLQRLLGPKAALDCLRSLRLVCISHMHSDHHAGLAALLRARAQLADPPSLALVAPKLIWLGLQDHHALESLGLERVTFVPAYSLKQDSAQAAVIDPLRLTGVRFVEVDHRGGQCFGCVIDHSDGWRIVYSGDTRPCERLVQAGEDADLLIHEATLDDEYVDSAKVKGHSTTGQALDIAKRMNAKVCLLTHFSQRYPKLPHLSEALVPADGSQSAIDIVLAFDMMRLRIGDAWKFRHYLPPLSALLRDIDPRTDKANAMRTD